MERRTEMVWEIMKLHGGNTFHSAGYLHVFLYDEEKGSKSKVLVSLERWILHNRRALSEEMEGIVRLEKHKGTNACYRDTKGRRKVLGKKKLKSFVVMEEG